MIRVRSQTRQRAAILRAIETGEGPLTAEEILRRARPQCTSLGERTVFRNLHLMVEAGELVRVVFPGQPSRYERRAPSHHPHLICTRCGLVFDLPCETPEVISRCTLPPGFEVSGEEVVLYGRCATCADTKIATTDECT